MLPTRLLLVVLAAAALAASGCGSSDDEGSTQTAAAGTGGATATTETPPPPDPATSLPAVADATDLEKKPKIATPTANPPDVLVQKDLVTGRGPAAKAGDRLTMQYVGSSFSNGKEFDTSWSGGEPFVVTLGQGEVIQGWDQGLVGMKAGGRRELVIPPALGYGSEGQGDILPNETLVFVVDLLKIG